MSPPPPAASVQPIDVLAGVLRDARGRLLVCQRPPGKHLAGLWEFPGGKRDPGESRVDALTRELREELGIEVVDARPLCTIRHDYVDTAIRLDAWTVERWRGDPVGLDGQAFAWVPPAQLLSWPLASADRAILTAARLPDGYAITPEPEELDGFVDRIDRLLAGGVRLLQLRGKALAPDRLAALARHCRDSADRHGADLLINGQPILAAELGVGLHLPSDLLRRWHAGTVDHAAEAWLPHRIDGRLAHDATGDRTASPPTRQARGWLAASCHDAVELAMAADLGCDFAVLSPVAATPSHPGAIALGWQGLSALVADSPLPVYALGGVARKDIAEARDRGARGIAGIRAFWPDERRNEWRGTRNE